MPEIQVEVIPDRRKKGSASQQASPQKLRNTKKNTLASLSHEGASAGADDRI